MTGGNYIVRVEDVEGCFSEKEVILEAPEPFQFDIIGNTQINLGYETELQVEASNPIKSLEWSPASFLSCDSCLITKASPTNSITYRVRATDINGCERTETILIQVDFSKGVFIPSAFSPNDDGINDVFSINTDESVEAIRFVNIYNRWGELVYDSNKQQGATPLGWDGTFRGRPVQAGIYIYAVEIMRINGTLDLIKGDILLIR